MIRAGKQQAEAGAPSNEQRTAQFQTPVPYVVSESWEVLLLPDPVIPNETPKPELPPAEQHQLNRALAEAVIAYCDGRSEQRSLGLGKIKDLLLKGANVNSTPSSASQTKLLGVAIISDQLALAEMLIEHGANVHSTSENFTLPALFYAKSKEAAQLLIDSGAKADTKDGNGQTPLHIVRDFEIARVLVKSGAAFDVKNEYGQTALHRANDQKIARLLIEAGWTIDLKDQGKLTPLCYAKDREIAKLLLAKGAKIDKEVWESARDGLDRQSINPSSQLMELLIEEVSLEEITKRDLPQLIFGEYFHSAFRIPQSTQRTLLCRYFNPELGLTAGSRQLYLSRDSYGKTPMDYALKNVKPDMLQALLSFGLPFANSKNPEGSPLVHQIIAGTGEIGPDRQLGFEDIPYSKKIESTLSKLKVTLEAGAALDGEAGTDGKGRDVVRFAFESHTSYEVLDTILSFLGKEAAQARLNQRDKNGDTLLHVAVKESELAMIELLLKHGANPKAENRTFLNAVEGVDVPNTPLNFAKWQQRVYEDLPDSAEYKRYSAIVKALTEN